MMGLVTRTKEIQTPDGDGSTVTIRALSGKAYDRAQRVAMEAAMELMDRMGGMDKIQSLRSDDTTASADSTLDKDTVIDACVVGWKGPSFNGSDGQPVPCNADNRALMDAATRDAVFDAIIEISIRPTPAGSASA